MNNNVSMQNNSSENNGPRYCIKCGTPYGDANFCPNCGTPRNGEAKLESNNMELSFAVQCAKGLFSNQPMNSVENAAKSSWHGLWGIFGMVGCLLIGISTGTIIYKVAYGDYLSSGKMAWAMILTMVLAAFCQFFASAGIAKLTYIKAENRPSYVQIMNMNAVSIIPLVASSVIAFIFAFINGFISMGVLLIGLCVSMIITYFGAQKAAKFTASPLWLFTAVFSLDVASFIALVAILSDWMTEMIF